MSQQNTYLFINVVLKHFAVGTGKLFLSVEYIIDPVAIHKTNATPVSHPVNELEQKKTR